MLSSASYGSTATAATRFPPPPAWQNHATLPTSANPNRTNPIHLALPTLQSTQALGARLAALLRPGDTILLDGPLGAGKSALARALLRALTDDPALDVPSPTFTLVQAYDTPIGLVQHFDLWRLEGPAALRELGWDEADAALVEWPDRLGPLAPPDALTVTLAPAPNDARHATLSGWKDRL